MVQFRRKKSRLGLDALLLQILAVFLVLSISFTVLLHRNIASSDVNQNLALHPYLRSPNLEREKRPGTAHKRNLENEEGCESFGCPIYPPELTDGIRKEIEELRASKELNGAMVDKDESSGSYGHEHGKEFLFSTKNTIVAGLTQQGKDHSVNQDRGIVVAPFYTVPESSEDDFLIGIFDGHGDNGHEISQYLQQDLPKKLYNKLVATDVSGSTLPDEDSIRQVLNETFIEMDKEAAPSSAEDGGSTASMILRMGKKLYFANAGDSLSFLAAHDKSSGETTIVHRNRLDKPNLPEELERIQKMGGKVNIPEHPMNSRVVAFFPARNEYMTLAMSRSIADWPFGIVGVTAEPIIDVVDLNDISLLYDKDTGERKKDVELFVVSSSDGLFDHRQPQFVANRFASSFSSKSGKHPVDECANIVDLATPKDPGRYRDDITTMALKFSI